MSKRLFLGCALGLSLISLHASDQKLIVIGNFNETSFSLSHDAVVDQHLCDNNDLEIFNSNSTIHIQGNCRNIEILGWNNTITAEHAKNVQVFGNNNQLKMDKTNNLEIFGSSHTIQAKTLDNVELYGSGSKVYYQESLQANQPLKVTTFGAGHRVEKTTFAETKQPQLP